MVTALPVQLVQSQVQLSWLLLLLLLLAMQWADLPTVGHHPAMLLILSWLFNMMRYQNSHFSDFYILGFAACWCNG